MCRMDEKKQAMGETSVREKTKEEDKERLESDNQEVLSRNGRRKRDALGRVNNAKNKITPQRPSR